MKQLPKSLVALPRNGFVLAFLGYIALFVAVNWLVFRYVPRGSEGRFTATGQFGDTFGAANAFFSGAAFVGVAIAIYYQHKEMRAKEEADRRERRIARRTAKLQASMADAQARQAEVLLETARLNGTGLLIEAYREIIKESDQTSSEFSSLRMRHMHSVMNLRMLMHKHWNSCDSDWKPFMRASLKEDLFRVESLIVFSNKMAELGVADGEIIDASNLFNRESMLGHMFDRWFIMKSHVDEEADPALYKAFENYVTGWIKMLMDRAITKVSVDNSWSEFVKSSLEAIKAALGD